MIVEDAGDNSARMNEIWLLYRANSQTLGFMPRGAFKAAATRGTLIVGVRDSAVCGYLLYDLRRGLIFVTHLCLSEDVRGSGLARDLINELRIRHPEQEGIILTCRNDFEANKIWPRLDFEPVSERVGRSKEGFLKTKWWLSFGRPNLLSELEEIDRRIRIAVDTDVFIDLVEDRPQSRASRALIAGWAAEVSTVVVTKTVHQELGNNTDPGVRSRRRGQLTSFARADRASDDWKTFQSELNAKLGLRNLSPHDLFDLEHVSRTAAASIGYFASRDRRLIRRYQRTAWDLFQLRIGTPADVLKDLWGELSEPYIPAAIENTSFSTFAVDQYSDDDLYRTFSNRAVGERKKEFDSLLQQCRRELQLWELRVLRATDQPPVALFARARFSKRIEVPLLRVAGSHSATVGRQLAHMLRDYCLSASARVVQVTDPTPSPQIVEGLLAEGFIQSGSQWFAPVLSIHDSSPVVANEIEQLPSFFPKDGLSVAISKLRAQELSPIEALEIERIFAPLKIANSHVPTFVVPIKAVWAEQLFDTDLSASTLFARQDELGISREHVYYSGASQGSLRVPARILWYVTKESKRHGTGAIRAVSVVDEVVVGRPLDLFRRFSRLGVYQRQQVLRAAPKSGKLMAIRFSRTELLKSPIQHSDFKELLGEFGHNLVVRSPQKLPDEIFDVIYERGMHESN